ncbi:MAG: TetR/AcrR family transcriptional regulator [Desulfobacterales bacterium]|nr:TetR/AcrR family transcriptional regulator [Desulfobacterales bacterium]
MKPSPKKTGKQAWLAQGFKILKTQGAAGLTIENLTRAMNRTKGAFYHHFKNRQDYSCRLLELWEDRQANEIIRISKQKKTFDEINQTLVDLSEKAMDPEIEVAIRAWALRDPLAREFQERIDSHRVDFLKEMFALMTEEPEAAELFAMIRYCFYIGSHQIIPAMDEKTYKKRLNALTRMFTLYTQTL